MHMEKPNPTAVRLQSGRAVIVLLALSLVMSLPTPPSRASQETKEIKIDYAAAQQEISRFEGVLDSVINGIFGSSDFAVVQKAKGALLPGYGISITFVINIHRAVLNTPFGQVKRPTMVTPEIKAKLINDLKEKLIRAMFENGEDFHQLSRDDIITIVAFFEDRNFPDEPSGNKTIVLSSIKRDLDELGGKTDRLKEFRQRIKIVEY
jgi:hypothetical protein